jgi:hypothetical protein
MVELSAHDDPKRTTPRGLIRYASEFYAAAEAADEVLGSKPGYELFAPIPVIFMLGQSLELSLKSYLLKAGVPLRVLRSRKFGHQLMVCLDEAQRQGLGDIVHLSPDDEHVIAVTNVLYASKQLQYMVIGAKEFPIYGPLEQAARKLLDAIAVFVDYPPGRLPHAL